MIYIKDGIRFPEKKLQRMQIADPEGSGYEILNIDNKPTAGIYDKVVDGGNMDVNGVWFIDWQVVDKNEAELSATLNALKTEKAKDLSEYFAQVSARPIIETGYGFSVQAGFNDLTSFQTGVDLGSTEVRAADNTMHAVTVEQLKDVVLQIKLNGARLMNIKWALEDEIEKASIEELEEINFEERFA